MADCLLLLLSSMTYCLVLPVTTSCLLIIEAWLVEGTMIEKSLFLLVQKTRTQHSSKQQACPRPDERAADLSLPSSQYAFSAFTSYYEYVLLIVYIVLLIWIGCPAGSLFFLPLTDILYNSSLNIT